MILKQENPEILVSDNFKQTDFSIDEDSLHIIFDILRSKVYKDPIGSLCREIASNSRDAQREVGDFTTATEIEIADGRGDFFYIDGLNIIFRDFGIGLSPERMSQVYAKYGASTKRGSNDYTGGFGLGAKTPFAYCDAFTVRTIVDNVEYIYSIYIDESRKGKVALLIEQPCEREGNMTEIIIPLKDVDRAEFEQKCIRNTFFWSTRPKLINFERHFEELELANMDVDGLSNKVPGDYTIYKKRRFIESVVNVVIDGIYYPVDTHLLGYESLSSLAWAFVFDFNNGDLTISANREQLQYDDDTKRVIKEKVDALLELMQFKYDAMLADAPTIFHASMIIHNLAQDDVIFKALNGSKKFFYTLPTGAQVELKPHNSFEPATFEVMVITEAETSVFKIKKDEVTNVFTKRVMDHFDNLYIITAEQAAKQRSKMLSSINKTLINRAPDAKFVLFIEMSEADYQAEMYSRNYAETNKKDWEAFNKLGFTFKNYWDVVPDKTRAGQRTRKETVTLKLFNTGYFTRDNFKFQNGYFLHKNSDPIADMLFFHDDYETEIKNGSRRARQLEGLSALVAAIDPSKYIVVSSKLKAKYFVNYESVESFLDRHAALVQRHFERSWAGNYIDKAKSYLRLGFDSAIHQELEHVVTFDKVKHLDLLLVSSFLQERMPTFTLSRKDFSGVFVQIEKEYPLIDDIIVRSKVSEYVKLVREMKGYKQQLGII